MKTFVSNFFFFYGCGTRVIISECIPLKQSVFYGLPFYTVSLAYQPKVDNNNFRERSNALFYDRLIFIFDLQKLNCPKNGNFFFLNLMKWPLRKISKNQSPLIVSSWKFMFDEKFWRSSERGLFTEVSELNVFGYIKRRIELKKDFN